MKEKIVLDTESNIKNNPVTICKCEFSDRYWDKNGSKCLKCNKIYK